VVIGGRMSAADMLDSQTNNSATLSGLMHQSVDFQVVSERLPAAGCANEAATLPLCRATAHGLLIRAGAAAVDMLLLPVQTRGLEGVKVEVDIVQPHYGNLAQHCQLRMLKASLDIELALETEC